jgi:YgiT-type zinc finger domain-containing protein
MYNIASMSSISYGTCPCTGVYERRFVEVTIKVNDRSVVLTDVPQGACPNCGSRVYKAEVLELVESLMKWRST